MRSLCLFLIVAACPDTVVPFHVCVTFRHERHGSVISTLIAGLEKVAAMSITTPAMSTAMSAVKEPRPEPRAALMRSHAYPDWLRKIKLYHTHS